MTTCQQTHCPQCGQRIKSAFQFAVILGAVGMRFTHKELCLDFKRFVCRRAAVIVPLTKSQWKLCAALVSAQGGVVSRGDLLLMVMGDEFSSERTIDQQATVIRTKIGPYIESVHGMGLRWVADGSAIVKQRGVLGARKMSVKETTQRRRKAK